MNAQLKHDLDAARVGFTDGLNGLARAALTLLILASSLLGTIFAAMRDKCHRREA